MYWAQSAKPSHHNRPVSDEAWKLLKSLVPPMPAPGTQPQPAMLDWQGGGPPSRLLPGPSTASSPTASASSGGGGLQRATVTCDCGQCQLTFANPRPRNHSECCCFDCRQKIEW
jgi:hypothetical protein